LEAVTVNAELVKLPVVWQTSIINTDNAGIYQLIGTMEGYSQEIKWNLLVDPVVNVGLGEKYDLPQTLPVYMVDGTCSEAEIIWDTNNVQTSTAGIYKFTGTVNGINKPVTLTLNVA
jgi:internalin A